jgi:hypothetical protein
MITTLLLDQQQQSAEDSHGCVRGVYVVHNSIAANVAELLESVFEIWFMWNVHISTSEKGEMKNSYLEKSNRQRWEVTALSLQWMNHCGVCVEHCA